MRTDCRSADVAEYAYDALGRRIKAGGKSYYYDGGWRVLFELGPSGENQYPKCYVYGNYLDEVLMVRDVTASEDYYYAHDHLYSPVAMLIGSADILERYEYDAYGRRHVFDDAFGAITGSANPIAFTGQRLDVLDGGDLELMYYKNRYYDGENGRFLTRDPIGYADGMNLYQYVNSSSINAIDPLGLVVEELVGIGILITIANATNSILERSDEIQNLLEAMAAAAPGAPYAPALACEGNHPCEHCVWNCRMARDKGEGFAEDMSNNKEAVDDAFADLADTFTDSEWEKMPTALRKFMSDWVCSAQQDSDYSDNAAGRDCGCNHEEMSCEDCCSTEYKNGPDNPQPEGPGTDRPFGPRCTGRYMDEQEEAKRREKKNKGGGITVPPGGFPPRDIPPVPPQPEIPPRRPPVPPRPPFYPKNLPWPPIPGGNEPMLYY